MSTAARTPAAFVLVLALAVILGAWAFQLIGGYVPCKLCLEERMPYYVGVPLAAIAFAATFSPRLGWLAQFALALATVVFAWSIYLGTYHAGVEWGWWPGPPDCSPGGGGNAAQTGELLDQLNNIHVVSCTAASWRFPAVPWGLSFAGWNAVMSAILAVAAAIGATGLWRRRAGSETLA